MPSIGETITFRTNSRGDMVELTGVVLAHSEYVTKGGARTPMVNIRTASGFARCTLDEIVSC